MVNVIEVVESAGRMAQAKMLATKFSPVQWEIVRSANEGHGFAKGFLPLGVTLDYLVDGQLTESRLNRANVRSLAKANVVEPVYTGGTKVSNITAMRLTKFGYLVAETMKDVEKER